MPTATRRRAEEPIPEPVAEQTCAPSPTAEEAPSSDAARAASQLPAVPETPAGAESQEWQARPLTVKTHPDYVVLEISVAGKKTFYESARQLQTPLLSALRAELSAAPCVERARQLQRQLEAARQRGQSAGERLSALAQERSAQLAAPTEELGARLVALEAQQAAAERGRDAASSAIAILTREVRAAWDGARLELTLLAQKMADEQAARFRQQLKEELDDLVRRNNFALRRLAVLDRARNGNELRLEMQQAVQQIASGM